MPEKEEKGDRKMKKMIVILQVLWMLFGGVTLSVFAEIPVGSEQDQELVNLTEESGVNQLYEQLPKEAQGLLDESGIHEVNSTDILSLDEKDIWSLIGNGVKKSLSEPLRILAAVIGVVLLASLLGSFESHFEDEGMKKLLHIISVLCVSGILVVPIISLIKSTVSLIQQVSEFLMGFIPVYAGIISVSGKPVSAFTYNSMLLGAVELISFCSATLLIPIMGVYLALCFTGAATDQVQIGGICKSIQKFSTWVLGFLITIFVGLLTIKSFVANSADSVTLKTGKYLVSSFLPVVGGAIGDALTVLQSSVGVIKSTVGAFGILAVVVCFLPAILKLLLMNLAVRIAQGVSELLEVKKVSGLLDATGFVLSFLQSVLVCYGVMVIVSVSLMLVLGLNLG